MIKRLIILLVFICGATSLVSAQSNTRFTLVAAPQLNESLGLRVGADCDIAISNRWSVMPGLYWSMRHRDSDGDKELSDGTTHFAKCHDVAHFITVPLRMAVRVAGQNDGNFMLKLYFGPYIALGVGGTSKVDINKGGNDVEHREYDAFGANGRYRSRLDFGSHSGLSFVIKQHLQLGAFFECGFRDLYRQDTEFNDIMGDIFVVNKINIASGITVGYRF